MNSADHAGPLETLFSGIPIRSSIVCTCRRVSSTRVRESYANYQTEDEREDALKRAYGPNYERLVALKNKLDPTNVFHLNQNVRPTV